MKTETQTDAAQTPPRRAPARVAALQSQIHDRDETIRLLNEALSLALDEINGIRKAA